MFICHFAKLKAEMRAETHVKSSSKMSVTFCSILNKIGMCIQILEDLPYITLKGTQFGKCQVMTKDYIHSACNWRIFCKCVGRTQTKKKSYHITNVKKAIILLTCFVRHLIAT